MFPVVAEEWKNPFDRLPSRSIRSDLLAMKSAAWSGYKIFRIVHICFVFASARKVQVLSVMS